MKLRIALAGLVLVPMFASASTITFTGKVTDQTCTMTLNGKSGDMSIPLKLGKIANLSSKGATDGETTINVAVAACNDQSIDDNVAVSFESANVTSDGYLKNQGTAAGVDLQLVDKDGAAVNMSQGSASVPVLTLSQGAKTGTGSFKVRYIASSDQPTTGSVSATATYDINYL